MKKRSMAIMATAVLILGATIATSTTAYSNTNTQPQRQTQR